MATKRFITRNHLPIGVRKLRRNRKEAPPSKRVDTFLQRLAWSSQIILVVAGVFGYLLTVRPVHQKQLLDEQIAERTISLKAATSDLQKLQAEGSRLQAVNEQLARDATSSKIEAAQAYEKLRSNLALKLLSIPGECSVRDSATPKIPSEIPRCVEQFVDREIAQQLRPADRDLMRAILSEHIARMVASSVNVDKRLSVKSEQLKKEKAQTTADLANAEIDVRAEIHRLRVSRSAGRTVEPDPPTGKIIIRDPEDQQAYDNYFSRRAGLVAKLNQLNFDEAFFNFDRSRAHSDALAKVASDIYDSFRNRVKQPRD